VNLDDRARRAASDIRREIGDHEGASFGQDPFDRFERSLERKTRNQRVAAGLVAIGLIAVSAVVLARAFGTGEELTPATPTLPSGSILYGEWDEQISQASWRVVSTDGVELVDLGWVATCGQWFPDGTRILTSSDADRGPGRPLRPVVIDPAGSVVEVLDGTADPDLELGCGAVTPDGSRIVLEGFNEADPARNGIYSIRTSDGGDLERLTRGTDCCPQVSPDGTLAAFMRAKPGVQPAGAGAVFVVDLGSGRAMRITPWGSAFIGTSWSPDGTWIAFQRPYGRLYVVHPDGTDLHEVPVELPPGSGGSEPTWSPDGEWLLFVLTRDGASNLYAVRLVGTGLTQITTSEATEMVGPVWRPL